MKVVERSAMKWIGWLIVALIGGGGCSTQGTTQIGSNFIGDGVLKTVFIDSLSLRVSTLTFDSVETTTSSRMLVGSYKDADLGKVVARSFFQLFTPIPENTVDPDNFIFEHASMILPYDGYNYADTTKQATFGVYQLTEQLKGRGGLASAFYNVDSYAHADTPIGTLTFYPRPNSMDSVEIPLDQTFSSKLFDLIENYDPKIRTNTEFFRNYPGFMVSSDTTQTSCVLGFKKSIKLRMYYVNKAAIPALETYFDIVLGSRSATNASFNNLYSDRSNTTLQELGKPTQTLSSAKTDHRSYSQAGIGLGIRVSIPYLKDMLAASPGLIVSRVTLSLSPVQGSSSGNRELPASLSMYTVNKNNTVTSPTATTVQLNEDVYLGRDTNYGVDITSFVKSQLATDEFNDNALLFTIYSGDFNSTVNRLYVENAGQFRVTLKLYYVSVNQNDE